MLGSTSFACDRCGKTFECKPDELPYRPFGKGGTWDREQDPKKLYCDFCAECGDSLCEWLLAAGVAAQKK